MAAIWIVFGPIDNLRTTSDTNVSSTGQSEVLSMLPEESMRKAISAFSAHPEIKYFSCKLFIFCYFQTK